MNKATSYLCTAAIFLGLSLVSYADMPSLVSHNNISSVYLAQNFPKAYNDTFNQNQATLLKALPLSAVYYSESKGYFSLEKVQATAEGPYCTYKLTYFTSDGGKLTIEGCNGGIGDVPLKGGFNAYTITTPFGQGQAYLKAGCAKNKAQFYSQWLEVEPHVYCRFSAENVPDKYIKGLAANLKKLI